MAVYKCDVCDEIYDEDKEGVRWADLPDDWVCPVCGSEKSFFKLVGEEKEEEENNHVGETTTVTKNSIGKFRRTSDDLESYMSDIRG